MTNDNDRGNEPPRIGTCRRTQRCGSALFMSFGSWGFRSFAHGFTKRAAYRPPPVWWSPEIWGPDSSPAVRACQDEGRLRHMRTCHILRSCRFFLSSKYCRCTVSCFVWCILWCLGNMNSIYQNHKTPLFPTFVSRELVHIYLFAPHPNFFDIDKRKKLRDLSVFFTLVSTSPFLSNTQRTFQLLLLWLLQDRRIGLTQGRRFVTLLCGLNFGETGLFTDPLVYSKTWS